MSKVAIQGNASGTGVFTLASPNSNTDRTLTLPDEAGTIITSGSATVLPKGVPTFSAYLASSGGSIANATFTKLIFDTELWDTNSYFASSRFTPLIAGYYQINAAYQWSSASAGFITIMRNGNEYKRGEWITVSAQQDHSCSGIVYCNGSSDYIEIYAYQTSGGNVTPQGGDQLSWFDGVLVRAD